MEFDPAFVWQLYSVPNLAWPASVISITDIVPESASINDCYIVGTNPRDEWIDHQRQIAVRTSEAAWVYQKPTAGRRVYVVSLKEYRQFNGREWVPEANGVPLGGLTGQVLAKVSNTDQDVQWVTDPQIPPAGTTGQVLTKVSATDYDVQWSTVVSGGGGGVGGANSMKYFANSETISGVAGDGTLAIILGQGFGAYSQRGNLWQYNEGVGWVFVGPLSQRGIPEGGTTGQVLGKISNTDFAVAWMAPSEVGGDITSVTAGTGLTGGGTTGDVTLSASFGTTSTTVCRGNDSRLSDDRTASGLRSASSVVAISASAAPTAGKALVASSATLATWQTITATGTAGGDLSGTYPNPAVAALTVAGPTRLSLATVNDGEFLQRSGSTIVGASGTSAPQPVQVNGTLVGTRDAIDLVAGTNITLSGTDDSANGRVRVTVNSTGGSGDITDVVAGTGLTGGATSGSATLAVDFGTGANQVRHGNDAAYTDSRAPTGTATGDLSGTYPGPTVTALHSSATQLTIGAINDGEFLQRSGLSIVSAAGTSSPQPVQINGTLVGTRNAVNIIAGTGISLSGSDDSINNRVSVTITSSGGGSGGVTNAGQLRIAPVSPNALDDEFDAGSSDLSTRGWTCVNALTGAAMTRAGDVLPRTLPVAGDGNTYRSTLTKSGMLIQCYNAMTISKAVSPASNTCAVLADTGAVSLNTGTPNTYSAIWMANVFPVWRQNPGKAAVVTWQQQSIQRYFYNNGSFTGGSINSTGVARVFLFGDYTGAAGGVLPAAWAVSDESCIASGTALANTVSMTTVSGVGLEISSKDSAVGSVTQYVVLRSFRVLPSGSWPGFAQ